MHSHYRCLDCKFDENNNHVMCHRRAGHPGEHIYRAATGPDFRVLQMREYDAIRAERQTKREQSQALAP